MDNSFTLHSSMFPEITSNKKISRKKGPNKLALKKNIRHSSVFNKIKSRPRDRELILNRDSWSSNSTSSNSITSNIKILNNTPIVISDSDSAQSSTSTGQDDYTKIDTKHDYLPLSKYKAVYKWISSINAEKLNQSDDTNKDVKSNNIFEFDDMLSTLKDTLRTPVRRKEEASYSDSEQKVSNISSSDIIDNSEDDDINLDSQKSNRIRKNLLSTLYKDRWRIGNNLSKTEPRNRKNIKEATNLNVPKTERKPKKSLLYKNPYLEFPFNTVQANKKPAEHAWNKYLKGLCDTDSSGQSLIQSANFVGLPKTKLSFGDDKSVVKRNNADTINNSDVSDSDKENIINITDDSGTSENKFRRKFNINDKATPDNIATTTKKYAGMINLPKTRLSFGDDKPGMKIKDTDTISNNLTDDSDKENVSDFTDDSETLEDKLKRKLNINTKVTAKVTITNDKKNDDFLKKSVIEEINVQDIKISTIDKTFKKKTISSDKIVLNNLEITPLYQNFDGDLNKTFLKSFLASLSGSVKSTECDPSALIFRNNFKLYKNQLASKLFQMYNKEIFDNRIPEDTPVEWSDRLRGTAGYCYCKKVIRRTGFTERKVRIVLATKVLDSADRLRDTLIHEMCHAASWIINEVSNGHGDYWKGWTIKARQIFPELPPIKVCHNYKINTKYTYKCINCSYSFGRHTKSVDIEKKCCGHCHGKFEVVINKVLKNGEVKSVPVTPKKAVTGFALFVKENYSAYKTPQLNHGQVMKLLGEKFNEMKGSI